MKKIFFFKSSIFSSGAWQTTFEHIPSIRRYSHQSLTSTPISLITGKNLTKKSALKTKARSLSMMETLHT